MRARRTAGARSPSAAHRCRRQGRSRHAVSRACRADRRRPCSARRPADLGDEHPRPVQERHQHRRDGDRADGGDQPTDRGQPRPDATSKRDPGRRAWRPAPATPPRPRPRVRASAGSRLRRAWLGLQLHRSRSIASSMSRAISSAKGRPASSACFGYMLVAVKPGEGVHLGQVRLVRRDEEVDAVPARRHPRPGRRPARAPSAAPRGPGSTSACGSTVASPATYFAS